MAKWTQAEKIKEIISVEILYSQNRENGTGTAVWKSGICRYIFYIEIIAQNSITSCIQI